MNLDWMKKIPAGADVMRRDMDQPFNFSAESGRWVIATDGRIMVAVKGEVQGWPTVTDPHIFKTVTDLLKREIAGTAIPLSKLKDWAGPPNWPVGKPCTPCAGSGLIECAKCDGTGEGDDVRCEDCDHEHTCACSGCTDGKMNCKDCDGKGTEGWKLKDIPGKLVGVRLNRALLARAIDSLDSETVQVGSAPRNIGDTSHGMVIIDAPDCRVVIMGTSHEGECPVFGEEDKCPTT